MLSSLWATSRQYSYNIRQRHLVAPLYSVATCQLYVIYASSTENAESTRALLRNITFKFCKHISFVANSISRGSEAPDSVSRHGQGLHGLRYITLGGITRCARSCMSSCPVAHATPRLNGILSATEPRATKTCHASR